MSDLPKTVSIQEEGPREGFQIEKGPIATARKVELIDALSQTGVGQIQVVSFVSPNAVPQMADAEDVVRAFKAKPGVRYTALWLNDRGFERALACGRLDLAASITLTASETFLKRNQRRTMAENLAAQRISISNYKAKGIAIESAGIMAAFGCNFEGEVPPRRVIDLIGQVLELAAEHDVKIKKVTLADTMAWATPAWRASAIPTCASTCICMTRAAWESPTPTPGWRWASTVSMPRWPGSAAARSRRTRARPAMSAPRTSCLCARRWGSRPASISSR
jgi:hydroxymethylglutaryl-CoA lyase